MKKRTEICEKYQYTDNIFADMQNIVKCEYISDLPGYKDQIKKMLKQIDTNKYKKEQFDDFKNYIFN